MSDFETMCNILDKAEIGYIVFTDLSALNMYATPGTSRVIEQISREHEGVYGYSEHTVDYAYNDAGELLGVYIWG